MPIRHSYHFVQKARILRLRGASYDKIARLFNVSKSTIHYWFKDLPKSPFQSDPVARRKILNRARKLAIATNKAKKVARMRNIHEKVLSEIQDFPWNNILVQKAIVSFLYWAEGSKTGNNFRFTNTDPALCKLFLTFLRKAYRVQEENFRVKLYLHYYHRIRKTRCFWSHALNIPISQFEKIYIKKRSKTKRMRKNFAGICFITYGKGGYNLKEEVLYFAKTIQEKIAPVLRP